MKGVHRESETRTTSANCWIVDDSCDDLCLDPRGSFGVDEGAVHLVAWVDQIQQGDCRCDTMRAWHHLDVFERCVGGRHLLVASLDATRST